MSPCILFTVKVGGQDCETETSELQNGQAIKNKGKFISDCGFFFINTLLVADVLTFFDLSYNYKVIFFFNNTAELGTSTSVSF